MAASFLFCGRHLEVVTFFIYLGRFLTAYDNNFTVVVNNLRNAQSKWERFSSIFGWEGFDARTAGTFYKAIVQVALLFELETWVMTPRVRRILEGFHHTVARCIVGMKPWCDATERWEYPPL